MIFRQGSVVAYSSAQLRFITGSGNVRDSRIFTYIYPCSKSTCLKVVGLVRNGGGVAKLIVVIHGIVNPCSQPFDGAPVVVNTGVHFLAILFGKIVHKTRVRIIGLG